MDSGTLIAEVARRDGVLLDRNDPVLVVATAVDVVMAEHRAAMDAYAARIEAARPIAEDELRRAVVQGIGVHASDVVRGLNWRTALATGGVALVLLVCGFAGGYLYHSAEPLLVGVRAGTEKCEDQADGSRLCWIPVFERLPPATSK